MKKRVILFFFSILVFLLVPMYAFALTLNVTGGVLMGASEVDVSGTLYDVEFIDGSCISVFGGCDSVSDFMFDQAGALSASNAFSTKF